MTTLPERIAATLRADVAGMHAYAIQPSDGLIKLDAMENPFGLPPALQAELGERLGRVAINRYPQASVVALADELTAFVGLPAGCRLMLGNGSDELIDLLSVACDVPGATILAPLPGFVMYAMSAQLRGLTLRRRDADARLRARRGGHARRHRAAPPGAHLHRLPQQPHGQPVRRRRHRPHRRGRGRAARPGGVRRGLPAVLVAQPGCSAWRRTSMCW